MKGILSKDGGAPKVSVIMPIYNVEKYLPNAIQSILDQTLEDFELFLVDDGSSDGCGQICDEYAQKDPRINVIHKENGGAPSARNAAMDVARGKYLYFMDADDWAEPDMLNDMYVLAERDDAQLVIVGFYIDTYAPDGKLRTDEFVVEDMVFADRRSFREAAYKLFDKNLLYSPWNKLWQREYVEGGHFRFPDTFWDDFPFILEVIRDVERVTVSSCIYYHFMRARPDSETAGFRRGMYEKREEEHRWMKEIYRHWRVNDEESREMVARRYIERFIGCLVNLVNPASGLTYKQMRHIASRWINSKNVRFSLKLAKPKSMMMRIMLIPLKLGDVDLALAQAKFIHRVRNKNTLLFASLKARR